MQNETHRYQLKYHPRAVKFLRRSTHDERARIIQKINELHESPTSTSLDIKKLINTKHSYRMRVGTIRVVYEVLDKTIYIQDIDYRGSIY